MFSINFFLFFLFLSIFMGIVYSVLSFKSFKMRSWLYLVNIYIIHVLLLYTSLYFYIYFCISLPTDWGLNAVICFGKWNVRSRDRMPVLLLPILSGSIEALLPEKLDFHRMEGQQSRAQPI